VGHQLGPLLPPELVVLLQPPLQQQQQQQHPGLQLGQQQAELRVLLVLLLPWHPAHEWRLRLVHLLLDCPRLLAALRPPAESPLLLSWLSWHLPPTCIQVDRVTVAFPRVGFAHLSTPSGLDCDLSGSVVQQRDQALPDKTELYM
jgi:hypothetical protein